MRRRRELEGGEAVQPGVRAIPAVHHGTVHRRALVTTKRNREKQQEQNNVTATFISPRVSLPLCVLFSVPECNNAMETCVLGVCTGYTKIGQPGQISGSCINGACSSNKLSCFGGMMCLPAAIDIDIPKCTVRKQRTDGGWQGRREGGKKTMPVRRAHEPALFSLPVSCLLHRVTPGAVVCTATRRRASVRHSSLFRLTAAAAALTASSASTASASSVRRPRRAIRLATALGAMSACRLARRVCACETPKALM